MSTDVTGARVMEIISITRWGGDRYISRLLVMHMGGVLRPFNAYVC
jgi:hypothetical protein